MEPHANSGPVLRHWAAHGSLASVLAIGGFFLVAVPQPERDVKQGATRPTAVQAGEQAKPVNPADAKVKVIGASAGSSKPCDEQTWPYIDKSCLTMAGDKPAQARADPGGPLGLRDMLAGVRPAPALETSVNPPAREPVNQPVGSVTAIAPTPSVKEMQANTAGVASREKMPAVTDSAATTGNVDVPLPQARPDTALASYSDPQNVERDEALAPPPLSRAEQRRRDREMERERRRAAREFARERRRLEWAERRAANSNRIVRRWTEYSYDDGSRAIVVQQGSRGDRFFRNYR